MTRDTGNPGAAGGDIVEVADMDATDEGHDDAGADEVLFEVVVFLAGLAGSRRHMGDVNPEEEESPSASVSIPGSATRRTYSRSR